MQRRAAFRQARLAPVALGADAPCPAHRGAQVRSMMLSDAYVRSCCFPQKCAHTRVLNDKLGRMAVARAGEHTVCVAEFTKFFALNKCYTTTDNSHKCKEH